MDESLKNRALKILEDEQDQLDGAYDKQTDVEIPAKIEKVNVTQDASGRWSKNTTEEDSGLYDENVVGQLEQQLEDDAKTLQEFCANLDNIIISFNAQINAKKQEIVTLSTEAIGRNCWPGIAYSTTTSGGTIRQTTIGLSATQNFGNDFSYQQDRDTLKIFEPMAGPNVNYSASNPFDPENTVTLSTSYAGYGYENTKQDNGGSVVGTARTNLSQTSSDYTPRNVGAFRAYAGVGVSPDATITTWTGAAGISSCVAIASSIAVLLTEIDTLRTQRDTAVNRTNLNAVKNVKKEKELQNWGIKNLEKRVEARKTKNSSAISAVQSFS